MSRRSHKRFVVDDAYVRANAVALLAEVASGRVALADAHVGPVLDRAVTLGIIDASVLEHMDIIFALVGLRRRSRC